MFILCKIIEGVFMKAAPILWLDILINLFGKSIKYKYLHDIQAVITYVRIKKTNNIYASITFYLQEQLMATLDLIHKKHILNGMANV